MRKLIGVALLVCTASCTDRSVPTDPADSGALASVTAGADSGAAEYRTWKAFCIDSDEWVAAGFPVPAGIRACVHAEAWAWDRPEGRQVVVAVRNLQGSLGGFFDTARRFSLHRVGLFGGDFGSALVEPLVVDTRGKVGQVGSPAWRMDVVIGTDVQWTGFVSGDITGCAGPYFAFRSNFYRTCELTNENGFVTFAFMVAGKTWRLEDAELVIGGTIGDGDFSENGFGFSCREAAPGCGTQELDRVRGNRGGTGQQQAELLVGTPQGDVAAGLPVSVEVTIQDGAGRRVTGPAPSVTLALEPNEQGAILSGTLTAQLVDGVATFSGVRISRAGRGFVLSATAASLSGRSSPFDVRLRLGSVSVGNAMACGLSPLGDAYCWGRNQTGGLGLGTTGNESRPVLVAGNLSFAQVDAGSGSNIGGIFDGGGCGLTAEGVAYCWGRNDFGQLGNGTTGMDSNVPVLVAGGIAFQAISVGRDHACGLARAGAIYCWGSNQLGYLGNDNFGVHSNVPVLVAGGLSYTALFVGDFRTCGLATSGDIYCWGEAGPTPIPGPLVGSPTLLPGGLSFAQVDPGTTVHLCGVTVTRGGYCWGQDLGGGELGTGTPGQNEATPALVAGDHAWAYIGADGLSSCGLRVDGSAMCWGNDFNGELGQGTVGLGRTVPSQVVGGITFTQMDVGHGTVCATTSNGDAYCWGTGFWGERGDGTFAPQQATPVKVVTP